MNLNGKKAYSRALVDSSVHRRMMLVCPLAFGEIGVKERVKNILHYKKCASWMIAAAVLGCAAVALCFLTNPKKDFMDIRIVIPAGSEGTVHYSEEEILPDRSTITIAAGEGLGDTEVSLKRSMGSVGSKADPKDEPFYMTPGMPVRLNAKEGVWYKIGVAVRNPTDQDIAVYVRVKGVQVRIADAAADIGQNKKYVAVSSAGEKGKYYYVIGHGSGIEDTWQPAR